MLTGAPFLAAVACGLMPSETIELTAREVRVANIVSLECIAPSERRDIGALVVAVLPSGARSTPVTRAALAGLARRRVPALASLVVEDGNRSVTLHRSVAAQTDDTASDPACYAAAHVVEAGEPLTGANLVAAPCRDSPADVELHYDRLHGVLRATQPLASSDYIGRVMAPPVPFPDTEDALTLSAAVGPVRVERDVVAVQPSLGEAIFVRDNDGAIFRAPMASLRRTEPAP
jgi:hypothetical protein